MPQDGNRRPTCLETEFSCDLWFAIRLVRNLRSRIPPTILHRPTQVPVDQLLASAMSALGKVVRRVQPDNPALPHLATLVSSPTERTESTEQEVCDPIRATTGSCPTCG